MISRVWEATERVCPCTSLSMCLGTGACVTFGGHAHACMPCAYSIFALGDGWACLCFWFDIALLYVDLSSRQMSANSYVFESYLQISWSCASCIPGHVFQKQTHLRMHRHSEGVHSAPPALSLCTCKWMYGLIKEVWVPKGVRPFLMHTLT